MRSFIIYSFLVFSLTLFAQTKDKTLAKANQEYEAKKYAQAEAEYRISQSENSKKSIAKYNLGNAIYRQNQPGEAKLSYENAIKASKTREEKHQAYHNLGNAYMKEKNYGSAVEAYKNALRNNPSDEETRYNYALAKQMLKDNPPKDDKKDDKKDKKDDKKDKNQDKKDDNKDKDKDKENKDDKKDGGKDKQNPDKNNDQQGQPKPKPGGISKERLQSLLDAVNNEEKKIQEKINAKKEKGKPVQTEKDW